jgi:hypothetical protein
VQERRWSMSLGRIELSCGFVACGHKPPNKALKLTKGAEVRAPRHSAWQRTCSVPRSTFFINVPSQLNAVFCGRLGAASWSERTND